MRRHKNEQNRQDFKQMEIGRHKSEQNQLCSKRKKNNGNGEKRKITQPIFIIVFFRYEEYLYSIISAQLASLNPESLALRAQPSVWSNEFAPWHSTQGACPST